ncbi:MAG: AIPR family protein [Chloroflexi bacterium]|nr:AIPR family protein [Chloroflexota bacterium]
MDIQEYYRDFMQEIYARSGAEGESNISTFTDRMCGLLEEQGIIESFRLIGYKKTVRGIRVDACEMNDETGVLSLFVTDFRFDNTLGSLLQADITKHFNRAEKFLTSSLERSFHQKLEESASGYELAREIFEKRADIARVRFCLLSNAELSKRVDSIDEHEIAGYACSYDIWDLSRLYRLDASGKAREDIVVDFRQYSDTGVACLPAFTGTGNLESYLMVIPGITLADLYDRYGERLLEQNVRTFLQFRGKVNKGIRNTIVNEPGMFFAYNNGLSVTADEVITNENHDRMEAVTNLQIVNGGQTTAGIFTAMRKSRADLSNVYVQVKLSLVPRDRMEIVIPKISEYANTQNKVTAADFFSNHPFHLRVEEMSRRIWAPSSEGGLRETHWFYERARGQYANAQANMTSAKQREFLAKFPKHQMFTKTDLAKFENSMDMLPHVVSLGAQKNFAQFAEKIGKEWDTEGANEQFNELYFMDMIAKAILFRYLDNSIMKQDWYGGYKANIVTYSLAKLADMVLNTRKCLDLGRIWKEQALTTALKEQLLVIAEAVNQEVQSTPDENINVTEWCKKKGCWDSVQKLALSPSEALLLELIESEEMRDREKHAKKVQVVVSGIDRQKYVVEKGAAYWERLRQWNSDVRILIPKEMDLLQIACKIPYRIPSDKQSQILMDIERKAIEEGFPSNI